MTADDSRIASILGGGAWDGDARFVRAACRDASGPGYRDDVGLGFRLAGGPAPRGGARSGDRPTGPARDAQGADTP